MEQKLKVTLCFVGFSIHWKSMGSNVIWLPVDNLWKVMCFKYHLLCCTEKSKSYTCFTCIYASTKNIYIHGIFPFHKMLEKILLRTVHQTILWAPKNGSSVPLLWKKTFGPLVLFLKRCKSKWCQNVHVWVNVPCKRTLNTQRWNLFVDPYEWGNFSVLFFPCML